MARKKKQTEVVNEPQLIQVYTLDIKTGDWIKTNKGWIEAVSDAFVDSNGVISVEISDGVHGFMSNNQPIQIKR